MNCQTYRMEIDEAQSGVGQPPCAATQAHLRLCEACREFYHERRALRELVGGLEKVAAPPDFDFRLRARIAADAGSQGHRTGWASFAPGAVSIALAACFALTVAASLRFRSPIFRSDATVATRAEEEARPATLMSERGGAEQTTPPQLSFENSASGSDESNGASDPSVGVVDGGGSSGGEAVSSAVVNAADASRRRAATVMTHAHENSFAGYSRTAARRLDSATYDISPADINRLGTLEAERPGAGDEMSFTVPVQAPGESLKVVLRDERGGSRIVSIDPVSFGAQEIVGRKSSATRALQQSEEGVW